MADNWWQRNWKKFNPYAIATDIIRSEVKKVNPTLEDEVVVEVIGQPGCTKQQLYFLALAAANGTIRPLISLGIVNQIVSHSYGMLMIEYDGADNWVRCTIKYDRGMLGVIAASGNISEAASGFKSLYDQIVLFRGPPCNFNGDEFGFTSETIAGVPSNAASPGSPQLPFKGQPIVTACPKTPTPIPAQITQSPVPDAPLGVTGPVIDSPNPKPPGDNRSRGMVLTGTDDSLNEGELSTPHSSSGELRTTNYNGASPGGIGLSGSTGSTEGGLVTFGAGTAGTVLGSKCCVSVTALIPLVFSALSAPASDSNMKFPEPTSGPTGG